MSRVGDTKTLAELTKDPHIKVQTGDGIEALIDHDPAAINDNTDFFCSDVSAVAVLMRGGDYVEAWVTNYYRPESTDASYVRVI